MRAADTNVLVRLIVRDDKEQTAAADRYVENGCWVSTLALAEVIWVLASIYERTPAEQARTVEMLLENGRLVFENTRAVAGALALFRDRPSVGFSDCLIVALAQEAGHTPLGTFDKKLARLPDTERI